MSIITSKYTMTPIKLSDTNEQLHNIPQISENCRITDSRKLKDFKDQTFGGYNISKASTALEKAILEDKIEPALHWSLQLFLSGLVHQLWSKLMTLASKNINIYNPKLPEFLYNKNNQWNDITENSKFTKDNILLLRNHPTVRILLAEMIAVLVLSKKRKINTLPKIKKEEFIIDIFKSKLEAKDNRIVETIIKDDDPSEIRIAVNEMAYHIFHKNSNKALYWLNWILEWEKINSKKYGKYECAPRTIEGVDTKFCRDVVWLIWSVINRLKTLVFPVGNIEWINQINALWKLYSNKFTTSSRSKRQNLIIWTILYMTETIDYAIPLIDRPNILFQSLLGFDKVVASLKSQQINSTINTELLNVIVEDNYIKPEKLKEMEEASRKKQIEKMIIERTKMAKQKKINVESLDKLEQVSKMDKYLFA
jgi:hypothetical protein